MLWSFRRGSDCLVGCSCFPRPSHGGLLCGVGGGCLATSGGKFLRRPSSFESHSPCAVVDRPARKTPKAAGLQAKQLKPHWGSGSQLPTSGSALLRQIHRFVALRSQAKKSLSGSAENTPARHLLGGTIFERVSESETLPNTPATPPNKNTNRNDLGASNLYKKEMRTVLTA